MNTNFLDKRNSSKESLKNFLPSEMQRIKNALNKGKTSDFLDDIDKKENQRSEFIRKFRRIPLGCESFLTVLRKWNSYTPSLPVDEIENSKVTQYSIGGGYFLYVEDQQVNPLNPGYGLVIDPGYNFIHNFGLAGFSLDDIDGILITHAHNDHTNDFESILSILFQRNDKFIGQKRPKKIDLFLNVGSFKKFSNYLDLANKNDKNYIGNVIVMSPGQNYKIPNRESINFEIITLFTKHHEIVTADYSLGICFKLADSNILLTSDTGWDFEIGQKNEKLLEKHEVYTRDVTSTKNIDILIAHIGSIKKHEFEINDKVDNIQDYYYPSHLGVLGVISMVEKWKPDFCIVSEFGEELINLRESLTIELETTCRKLHKNIRFIPGDIGLFINITSKSCLCYETERFVPWNSMLYMDVLDENTKQRSIKYYSCDAFGSIKNLEKHIEAIEMKKGIDCIRKIRIAQLLEDLNREIVNDGELIYEISNLRNNWENPYEDDAESEWIDRLILLSHISDNPLKILDILDSCHRTDLIKDFLNSYGLVSSYLEIYFAKSYLLIPHVVDLNLYLEYLGNKHSMSNFIELYKKILSFSKNGLDFYKDEIVQLECQLNAIGNGTVEDGWNSLETQRQIDIIVETQGTFDMSQHGDFSDAKDNIELSKNMKNLLECAIGYYRDEETGELLKTLAGAEAFLNEKGIKLWESPDHSAKLFYTIYLLYDFAEKSDDNNPFARYTLDSIKSLLNL